MKKLYVLGALLTLAACAPQPAPPVATAPPPPPVAMASPPSPPMAAMPASYDGVYAGSLTLMSAGSAQADLAVEDVLEPDLGDAQNHLRLEQRPLRQLALFEGVAHRQLDLALRGDADGLQVFADVHVEAVFVHLILRSPGLHAGTE